MLIDDSNEISQDNILHMIGNTKSQFIEELLEYVICGNINDAINILDNITQQGGDSFNVCKQIQKTLYKYIIDTSRGYNTKYKLSHLLYLWQILLKQTENIKNSVFPEYILNATIVMMAYTSSIPKLEEILSNNKQQQKSSQEFLNEVLKQFPGSNMTEIY